MTPRPWTRNDAWILAAIALVKKEDGATLAEIIAAADAINRAIPTAEELTHALSRLAGCGIVLAGPDRYRLAPERRPAVERCLQGEGGLFGAVDRCVKWLDQSRLEPARRTTIRVSEAEVQAAYDGYRASLSD